MTTLTLTSEQRRAYARKVFQAGVDEGTRRTLRIVEIQQHLRTFSDPPVAQPSRGFMQVFSEGQFEEAFALYFNDDHYPEGFPRYIHKFFGINEQEFGDRSKRELVEVEYPDGKLVCKWLNPSWIEGDLPEEVKEFAASRTHLRRVQITDKNGVKTWRWKRMDEKTKATAERTQHPENEALDKRPTADYHPTAAASQKVQAALSDPTQVTAEQLPDLLNHLDTLKKEQLKDLARQIQMKVGGLKMDLINRFLDRLRSQGQQPATPPPAAPTSSPAPPDLSKPQPGEKASPADRVERELTPGDQGRLQINDDQPHITSTNQPKGGGTSITGNQATHTLPTAPVWPKLPEARPVPPERVVTPEEEIALRHANDMHEWSKKNNHRNPEAYRAMRRAQEKLQELRDMSNPKLNPAQSEVPSGQESGSGSNETSGQPPETSGSVAGASGEPSNAGTDQGGSADSEPADTSTSTRIPASVERVNRSIDRFTNLFRAKGQHQIADFMDKLKSHINFAGVAVALDALGAANSPDDDKTTQYESSGTAEHMSQFCKDYLARTGISVIPQVDDPANRVVSSVSSTEPHDPYMDGSFSPVDPTFKNKLDEAKHLPGLEASEDIANVVGKPVTHLTPEVMGKMDDKFGKGRWIIKAYGDDAYAGYGIFFPQRSTQINQDAKNSIWSSGEQLARYGFSHLRDESGKLIGIKHDGGSEYLFGSDKYNSTIHGEARRAADSAAAAAPSERGAELPGGGKEFMVQPAFEAVGVSDADRAAGKTIAPGEGRTHIVTRNGKATLVPHSTWIKGEHLPVVFESDDTKAMARAAVDAINNLPESERQGQIYAPDIIKAIDGYRVVEANPTSSATGGSGYLEDNPFIINAYVSHLTGREPAHVRFIRKLLTENA